MAAYTIDVRPRARRSLRQLDPPVRKSIAELIDGLAADPRPAGVAFLTGHRPYLRVRSRVRRQRRRSALTRPARRARARYCRQISTGGSGARTAMRAHGRSFRPVPGRSRRACGGIRCRGE